MKSKLNLTIDKDLIPLSKTFARKKGKSVSKLNPKLIHSANALSNQIGILFSLLLLGLGGGYSLMSFSVPNSNLLFTFSTTKFFYDFIPKQMT